jgi:hypothetical protein
MQKCIKILLVYLVLTTLFSCSKICDCVESTGSPTEETITVPYFEKIYTENNINVFISMGSPEQVQLQGGKNLLSNISATVSNGVLTLKNNNICNWLRSYKKSTINVYVTMPRVTQLTNDGVGTIQSLDTLTTDTIQVKTLNAGGINLIVKNQLILGDLFGPGDLTLSGTSTQLSCNFVGGTGFMYCDNLNTGYTFLSTSTTGDCYVGTTNSLSVVINQIGNVYYRGNPTILKTINGSGQLIQE